MGKARRWVTIYFVSGTGIFGNSPVKIGQTTDLSARVRDLQTAQPYPIKILASFEGPAEYEAAFHWFFGPRRLNGEWFRRCGQMECLLQSLRDNGGSRPCKIARRILRDFQTRKHARLCNEPLADRARSARRDADAQATPDGESSEHWDGVLRQHGLSMAAGKYGPKGRPGGKVCVRGGKSASPLRNRKPSAKVIKRPPTHQTPAASPSPRSARQPAP